MTIILYFITTSIRIPKAMIYIIINIIVVMIIIGIMIMIMIVSTVHKYTILHRIHITKYFLTITIVVVIIVIDIK